MIEIKKLEGRVIRLYSFDKWEAATLCNTKMYFDGIKVLFSGTKSELLEKEEDWCKEIVECKVFDFTEQFKNIDNPVKTIYKNYENKLLIGKAGFATAKESGLSLLETIKEENIIITEEKI
jgi:hypothetical protein